MISEEIGINDDFWLKPDFYQKQWEFDDYFGDFQQILTKKSKPWQCPQCFQRFKWDGQLRRHQVKMNHFNPDRVQRRSKKYQKYDFYQCKKCFQIFGTHLQRVQHYRWCQKDPKIEEMKEYYKSSLPKYEFECKMHDIAYYFSRFENLKEHLRNHRIKKIGKELNRIDRSKR